jgi:hypothetical protein
MRKKKKEMINILMPCSVDISLILLVCFSSVLSLRDGMLVTEGIVHVDVVLHAGTDQLGDISGFMYWVD